MNSIFFAQNVPSNSKEIRLQYNNRTLYPLQVTCAVINSMSGGTVNNISYTIPSMTLVTKTIPILSSGISINALTRLSISNAPSQFLYLQMYVTLRIIIHLGLIIEEAV